MASAGDGACRPAGQVKNKLCGNCQPVVEKGRINAAFKTLARIARQSQLLSRAGNMFRIEKRAFDEDIHCVFRNTAMFAAHDAANVMHHRVVGYDGHAGIQRVAFTVERNHLFAVHCFARYQRTI